MPKGKLHAEIFLFFHSGFKNQQIIKLGYNRMTVYRYRKMYNLAVETYKKLVKMIE